MRLLFSNVLAQIVIYNYHNYDYNHQNSSEHLEEK